MTLFLFYYYKFCNEFCLLLVIQIATRYKIIKIKKILYTHQLFSVNYSTRGDKLKRLFSYFSQFKTIFFTKNFITQFFIYLFFFCYRKQLYNNFNYFQCNCYLQFMFIEIFYLFFVFFSNFFWFCFISYNKMVLLVSRVFFFL